MRPPHDPAPPDRDLLRSGRESQTSCSSTASWRLPIRWTKETWVYDLRTNRHFTLKTSPLRSADLADLVDSYRADDRSKLVENERIPPDHVRNELVARDKANLDITWLRDESLDDASTLSSPGVLAAEIAEELEAALAQFSELATSLPMNPTEES
jgi:type I restriction enzyme M protein